MIKKHNGAKKPYKNCLRIHHVIVCVATSAFSNFFVSHLMPRSMQNNSMQTRIKEKTEPLLPEISKYEQNRIIGIQRDQIKNARVLRGLLSSEFILEFFIQRSKIITNWNTVILPFFK